MKKAIIGFVILLGIIVIDGYINQKYIVETEYNLSTDKVDDNYTFAQISDYHSSTNENEQIFEILDSNQPDYIILSGDILESEDMEPTVDFISKLTDYGTVIYSRGNHDDDYNSYQQFLESIKELGVIVVGDSSYQVDDLNFIGIEDFSGANLVAKEPFTTTYTNYIGNYQDYVQEDKYNILLGHRPSFLEAYSNLGVDLVFSGHAHGGQWQIPFTDIGFIAPDDGIFTSQVHGLKQDADTTQIISSGTSNPYEPFIPRLFNRKEVVIVNLSSE